MQTVLYLDVPSNTILTAVARFRLPRGAVCFGLAQHISPNMARGLVGNTVHVDAQKCVIQYIHMHELAMITVERVLTDVTITIAHPAGEQHVVTLNNVEGARRFFVQHGDGAEVKIVSSTVRSTVSGPYNKALPFIMQLRLNTGNSADMRSLASRALRADASQFMGVHGVQQWMNVTPHDLMRCMSVAGALEYLRECMWCLGDVGEADTAFSSAQLVCEQLELLRRQVLLAIDNPNNPWLAPEEVT